MSDRDQAEQVELLRSGVEKWNQWRKEHAGTQPDLVGAVLLNLSLHSVNLGRANLERARLDDSDLSRADLGGARLHGASLRRANLSEADLSEADLSEADLSDAVLFRADLRAATLRGARLSHSNLRQANLQGVDVSQMQLHHIDLSGAQLAGADLRRVNLTGADLRRADLRRANLSAANLDSANLVLANLSGAIMTGANLPETILRQANLTSTHLDGATLHGTDLTQAQLIRTSLRGATLADCRVYGISTWDLSLENAIQTNLCITPDSDTEITSDDLEVAQFLYLMLHNDKIRRVIDTITSKVVLILGRFTPERKRVLDALRTALREHPRHYVPVLFDFEGPDNTSLTDTITLLAKMARFVIADLTEPASVPYELALIVPEANVPVQTLLLEGESTFSMAVDLWRNHPALMLPLCHYSTLSELLAILPERVIAPAESRAQELQRQRMRPVPGLS